MTQTKKAKKKIPTIKKYSDGYFVGANGAAHTNALAMGLNTASGIVGAATQNSHRVSVGGSTAQGALSGAATGATIGSVIPGVGTVIGGAAGAVAGGIGSYIGAEGKLKAQNERDNLFNSTQLQQVNNGLARTNINPYGTQMYALGDEVTPNPSPPPLSPKNYLVNYMNSPVYNKRLTTTGVGSKPQSLEDMYNTNIFHNDEYSSQSFTKGQSNKYNPLPVRLGTNNIVINPNQIKVDGANEDEVQAHELSHLQRNLTPSEQNLFSSRNISPLNTDLMNKYKTSGSRLPIGDYIEHIDHANTTYHDVRPGENKADLDALRYQMYKGGIYDTSKGDLDLPTLQKALSDPTIKGSATTRRLLENFKPEDLVYLNNSVASVIPDESNKISGDIGNYAFGGMISHNPIEVTGKFNQPNIGMKHFAPKLTKQVRRYNPLQSPVDFNNNSSITNHPQSFEDGDMILDNNPNNQNTEQSNATNTQQNTINIQKGELLIHPDTGKILQEYQGINPLTGGLYESHAKGKQEESENNFTLADPGLFVITKKTAKQYKDAVDNNDKISQKTVLMNIRNAKIQKQGGLPGIVNPGQTNYEDGDYIDPTYPNPITGLIQNTYNSNQPMNMRPNLQVDTTFRQNSVARPDELQSRVTTPNTTFSDVLGGLNKYGPSLVNLAEGTFGKAETQPYAHAAVNPYRSQVEANMPKDIDMSPIINDIRSTQNLEDKNLENNTSNSAVNRANRQQIASNTNKNLISARLQGQQVNNQTTGQRAYMYNALGYQDIQDQQQRRQYDLGVDDINARRVAAKQNLFNAGLSQFQQVGMNDKQNQQKAGMDKYTLGLMQQIFPNLKYYDDFDADKVNKMLGR